MIDFLLMVGGALFAMFVSGIVNYKKSVWVGLTDAEIDALESATDTLEFPQTVRAIEQALKDKNT
jgi:hypothetical protein